MYVLTIGQTKGGVSKSTIAINLAGEAVRMKMRAVILEIDDNNHQGTASNWATRREAVAGASDLLKPLEDVRKPPEVERVPATKVRERLEAYERKGLDLVVMDLPGSRSAVLNEAVRMADMVLLPTRPQIVDLEGTSSTLEVIHRARRAYAFVITRVGMSNKGPEAKQVAHELEQAGHPVAPQIVGQHKAYWQAMEQGLTAHEKDLGGDADQEMRRLWKWTLEQLEEAHAASSKQEAG